MTGANLGTLSDIFARCPLAWRVLRRYDTWYPTPEDTRSNFTVPPGRPLAPALRALELQLDMEELTRVLSIGFADVILPAVTVSIANGHYEDDVKLLIAALLPGLGPLLVFACIDGQRIELRDAAEHTRCFDCDAGFAIKDAWKYLSLHYDLHKSVREIRVLAACCDEYVDAFEAYPPQFPDGITLALHGFILDGDLPQAAAIIRLSGLAKVVFSPHHQSLLEIQTILIVLACIEPSMGRIVEVCIGDMKVDLSALQMALAGPWEVCRHCRSSSPRERKIMLTMSDCILGWLARATEL